MTSDLRIPRTTDILDRVFDCRASAVRLQDVATADQLTTLVKRLPFARFCWELGVLVVDSPSGNCYRVSNAACSCLNGQAGKKECWHWHLRNILLDMFDTEAETADQEADPPGPNDQDDSPGDEPPVWPAPNGRTPWYARATVARRAYA